MGEKDNDNYGGIDSVHPFFAAVAAVFVGIFIIIGIGGILLSGLYMVAVASMAWTGFVRFGPLVGLVTFLFIICFFGAIGVFVYQLVFADDKSYDRGDNFDNY